MPLHFSCCCDMFSILPDMEPALGPLPGGRGRFAGELAPGGEPRTNQPGGGRRRRWYDKYDRTDAGFFPGGGLNQSTGLQR